MSMKYEDFEFLIGKVADQVNLTPTQKKAILEEFKAAEDEIKAEKEAEKEKAGTKPRPQLILLATQDIPGLMDVPFFAVEVSEEVPHTDVPGLFSRAVAYYNQDLLHRRGSKRKKHKRQPLEELGEAMDSLPRTWLKAQGITARFKTPGIVVVTPNELTLPVVGEAPPEEGTEGPARTRAAGFATVGEASVEWSAPSDEPEEDGGGE